ncbi:hypothetical protein ACQREA_14595 [Dietzia cinnamea]|uniref:hypothetical protein n=1 Tax=Dietzia cinnamea TaxID=321318 RepID=UPI003D00E23C
MTFTPFPAIFRDPSLLIPAPANAGDEVIGVDPATGYHVLNDGGYDPATVPDEVMIAKATDFATYMNTLARRLLGRISATGSASWNDECEALTGRNLVEDFAGYIYRRDLRTAEHLRDALLAQRDDRIAGRALPDRKVEGPARQTIRSAAQLGAYYRRQVARLTEMADAA